MTSYTRKLYSRDPGAARAAEDFARQSKLDRAQDATLRYGKVPTLACFHSDRALYRRAFGKREIAVPIGGCRVTACAANCGHRACSNGCTLQGRGGSL